MIVGIESDLECLQMHLHCHFSDSSSMPEYHLHDVFNGIVGLPQTLPESSCVENAASHSYERSKNVPSMLLFDP